MLEREPNISQNLSIENVIVQIKTHMNIQQKVKQNTYLTKWLHYCIYNNHVKENEYTITALSFQAQWREKKWIIKWNTFSHITGKTAATAYS